MPTFPPPSVDITSKTWPSFADMLLRRWREGEHLGRVFFFSAPLCHTSTRLVKTSARLVDPRRRIHSLSAGLWFECNFWSPTLFIDFDLRDSDVGVPQRCLLPSETTAPTACRQTRCCSIGAHLYPFVAVKKKKEKVRRGCSYSDFGYEPSGPELKAVCSSTHSASTSHQCTQ